MDDALMAKIDALNDEYITEEDSPEAPPLGNQIVQDEVQVTTPWLPIDLYRNTQRKIIANSKRSSRKEAEH